MAYNTATLFQGHSVNDKNVEYHTIVTKNKTMEKLGLSNFTASGLLEWCNQTENIVIMHGPQPSGGDGEILNKEYLAGKSFNKIMRTNEGGVLNVYPWRNKAKTGYYETFKKFANWEFKDLYQEVDKGISTYKHTDIGIDEFRGVELYGDSFTGRLVAMSNDLNDRISDTGTLRKIDKIRNEFFSDIMSSKDGHISWSGEIGFTNLSIDATSGVNTLTTSGEKKEWVEFDMYFFSAADQKQSERRITLKNLNYVGQRSFYDTGQFVTQNSGSYYNITNPQDPHNEVAGEVDLQYTEFLGKWESGSPQMVAVLSTDLPAAEALDISFLEERSVEEILDPEYGQEIIRGSAIPLHMQHGNPLQWAPNYDLYEHHREPNNYAKSQVKVANLSNVGYARGQYVILNRIEGVWFVLAGAGQPVEEILTPIDPQWNFTYLMTNIQFLFKNKADEDIDIDDIEKGFYAEYYDRARIHPDNKNRYDSSFIEKSQVHNEYYQVTSWDFMAGNMGGLRTTYLPNKFIDGESSTFYRGYSEGYNGNALSNTVYSFDVEDKNYENEVRNTYCFFGCVFPDGYKTQDLIDKVIKAKSLGGTDMSYQESFISVAYDFEDKQTSTSDQLPFMTPAGYGTILDNINDVSGFLGQGIDGHQNLGMFKQNESSDGSIQSSLLNHLPADIATNASPSGKWGSPISSISVFDPKWMTGSQETLDTKLEQIFATGFFRHQRRFSWAYEKPAHAADQYVTSGVVDSAWDLEPNRWNVLQFRPLSRELYSHLSSATPDAYQAKNPQGLLVYDRVYEDVDKTRSALYPNSEQKRLFETIKGFYTPVSAWATFRNASPDQGHLYAASLNKETLIGEYGLKYAKDIPKQFLDEIKNGTAEGYPYLWWSWGAGDNSSWYHPDIAGEPQAAGGIGIIGAVASFRAKNSIEFNVTNRHLPYWNELTQQELIRSMDLSKSQSYKEPHTTSLYMRCYQKWPREQTLFDPRFLVVHHFNEGVGYKTRFHGGRELIVDDIYTMASGLVLDGKEYADTDASVISDLLQIPFEYSESGWFFVHRKEFGVDFRIPTTRDQTSGRILNGRDVYGDSDKYGLLLRQREHWNINSIRRGQLLPFTYAFSSIQIGHNNNINIHYMQRGETIEIGSVGGPDIVVTDLGLGYAVGEQLTVQGGTGGGTVLEIAEVGSSGQVTDLIMKSSRDHGFGYSRFDFLNAYDDTGPNLVPETIVWPEGQENAPTFSALTLQPHVDDPENEAKGTGFTAYVIKGTIGDDTVLTDAKPKEALDMKIIKLSTPQLSANLNGDEDFTFNIVEPDPTNSYDLFFRYQNDISHVAIGATNVPNATEQMVELQINTNLGGGGAAAVDQGADGISSQIFADAQNQINEFEDSIFFQGFMNGFEMFDSALGGGFGGR